MEERSLRSGSTYNVEPPVGMTNNCVQPKTAKGDGRGNGNGEEASFAALRMTRKAAATSTAKRNGEGKRQRNGESPRHLKTAATEASKAVESRGVVYQD
jgi:hypothetical protein